MSQYSALEVGGKFVAGLCVLCLRDMGRDQTLGTLRVLCDAQEGALHNKKKMFSC